MRSEIRAGPDAEALHLARGDGSDAVELPDRQRCDEVQRHVGRDDELTIRFALAGCELGEELVVGDTGRSGQTGLLENARPNLFRRGRGGLQASPVPRDVQIGFIE